MFNSRFLKLINSQTGAITLVVVFLMLTANVSLFQHIVEIYPLTIKNMPFLASLTLSFSLLTAIFFMVVSFGRRGRWLIALLLILSAQTAYYMDQFGVLMDVVMIGNILHTDALEVKGLFSSSMAFRLVLFGIFPAWLVVKYWPQVSSLSSEVKTRLKCLLLLVVALVAVVLPFTAGYFSFIREHKITRFYANPTYPVYSIIKYGTLELSSDKQLAVVNKTAEDVAYIAPA